MNEIYIKQRGGSTEVFIDNVKVQRVKHVSYENDIEYAPMVKLEFYTDKLDIYVEKGE